VATGYMDRSQLLQHFHTLAETPDAVAKLRDLVLQLAVRGSLLPQDPKDEPAKELASKVISVAKQVAKERELKLPAPEFSITDQDKVFPLPNGWTWVKLGDVY
jgi:type I restriction enzyme S subunit